MTGFEQSISNLDLKLFEKISSQSNDNDTQSLHAAQLDNAVTAVYASGTVLPVDQGGTASTTAFADAVLASLDA